MMGTPLYTVTDLDQATVLRRLREILFPDVQYLLDPTWGSGNFYPDRPAMVAGDIRQDRTPHIQLDYRNLPFADRTFDLTIFDPPFQPETVPGVIGRKFTKIEGGVAAVRCSVTRGLLECRRVSRIGLIVKVQDYIHDHKPVWMSMWVWETLGEPYDVVHVRRSSKLRATNWHRQLSVWRNHATFWAYRWESIR